MLNLGRQQAITFLKWQAFATLLVSGGFLLASLHSALAALVGGGICLIANLFFVYRAFRASGATKANNIAGGFVLGEIGKIFITVAGMALAFIYTSLPTLPLLLGFLLTQSIFWVAPFIFRRPQASKA